MGNKTVALDPRNTSSKEIIRKNIRHALTLKGKNTFPSIDLSSDLFSPIENPLIDFVKRFRDSGGKYVPCTPENFLERLVQLIKSQNYNTILCPDRSLGEQIGKHNIVYSNVLLSEMPADVAIVYSDLLVARSGSVVLSQKYMLYPSIKNLATDVVIVSRDHNIVRDFKEAFAFQAERNSGGQLPLFEIITPSKLQEMDGKMLQSPTSPRYILLLVS